VERRLQQERERLSLSIEGLANIAGVTPETIQSWEARGTSPDASHLEKMALAGVDVFYLLTGTRASSAPPLAVIPAGSSVESLGKEAQTLIRQFRLASAPWQATGRKTCA